MTKLAQKFSDVESSMDSMLIERTDEIHTSLLALLTNSHHFQYGEPGCLAGSTMINVNRQGNGRQYTLEDIICKFNGGYTKGKYGSYSWDQSIPTMIQHQDDEGFITLTTIKNAWCSGTKETFELTTETGRQIRATDEHPFKTPEGWARLDELSAGDLVEVRGIITSSGGPKKIQYKDTNVRFHPYQRKAPQWFRHKTHRLVYEASLNNLPFDDYINILRHDEETSKTFTFLPPEIAVHHIDHNPNNNNISNLAVTTHSEHGKLHADNARRRVLIPTATERIVSIEKFGEEATYDIEVEDSPHNYVANGFVVHNTAKSMLVSSLCDHISDLNGDSFQYLLTKYTTPEEISGIVDLNAFREGTFRKITSRKLPEAKVAFLDETFNGSSAILNTLLEIINERKFDRGDEVIKVPLISLFGASNNIPHNSELRALADRLHFWHWVKPIQDASNRAKLLTNDGSDVPASTIVLDDINAAQGEVDKVEVPDEVVEVMLDVYESLQDNQIHITDRRFKHGMKVVQAEAWFNGRREAIRKDIRPLRFMFWQDPEQINTVNETILNKVSVVAADIAEIRSSISSMMASLKETVKTSSERVTIVTHGSEVISKLSVARDEVKELKNRDQLDEEDIQDIEELARFLQRSYAYVQREIFHIEDVVDPSLFQEG